MEKKIVKRIFCGNQKKAIQVFLLLIPFLLISSSLSSQTMMSADTERVSNAGPLRAKLVSSSVISSYRFYNPFLIRNVNSAGDQFGFDPATNTLLFYIDRMGSTNSREQSVYLIFNNAPIDYIKATRQTSQYDETYFVRAPEIMAMPEHWNFDPLGDWIPFPFNGFLKKQALAYNLGVSDWSGGVGVEVKFMENITNDLVMTIMAVNPNRSSRDMEILMRVPFSKMLNLVKYLGESNYSDFVSFANYHFEYKGAGGASCNNLLLSGGSYSEKINLNAAVERELGAGHSIADWNDLKSIRDIDAWIRCMGLQNGQSFMVTRNGVSRLNNGSRQFFVRYAPNGVPSNFAVHDKIGEKLFLGSWYDLNMKTLVRKR